MTDLRTTHAVDMDWWDICEEDRDTILTWMERGGIPRNQARWVRLRGEGQVEVELICHGPDRRPYTLDGKTVATVRRTFPVSEPPPACFFRPRREPDE